MTLAKRRGAARSSKPRRRAMLESEELRGHRARMRKVKSTVDTSAPASSKLKHMQGNAKAESMAKARATQIERDNRQAHSTCGASRAVQKAKIIFN